jgi:hypothetical protein
VWLMKPKQRQEVDKRLTGLGGLAKNWLGHNLSIFEKSGACKSAEHKRILQQAIQYLFHDIIPKKVLAVWNSLILAMNAILSATADIGTDEVPGDQEIEAKRLYLQVIEALVLFERDAPETELSMMFHILIHMPDAIHRWGSCRNFWAFFNERYFSNTCGPIEFMSNCMQICQVRWLVEVLYSQSFKSYGEYDDWLRTGNLFSGGINSNARRFAELVSVYWHGQNQLSCEG